MKSIFIVIDQSIRR